MSKKVLVAFATVSGTTREVAEAIGGELRLGGHEVDVAQVREVASVAGHAAAVVGTPVMGAMLNGSCKRFLRRHRKSLAKMRVGYFISCGMMSDPTPENIARAESYMAKLRRVVPGVEPVDTALFAGGLKTEGPDFDRANFFLRLIIPKIAAEFRNGRDLTVVRDWARGLIDKL